MKYIVAAISKAEQYQIKTACHRKNNSLVILNEKEVGNCLYLDDFATLESKAQELGGSVLTLNELQQLINSGGLSI